MPQQGSSTGMARTMSGDAEVEARGRQAEVTRGRELAISVGQRVALLENDPDQLIASGPIQLEHALSHAERGRQETRTLKSEHLRGALELDAN